MKTYFIISLLAIFAQTNLQAQGSSSGYFAAQSINKDTRFHSISILTQKAELDSAKQPVHPAQATPQTNRLQKIDQFVRGSFGFSNNMPSNYLTALKDNYPPVNNLKNRKLTATVTGFALVARTIPYFLKAIRNKAGLRFCCQKTTFGTLNKARKKVTGITFAIPIGK
jgi:hypothetical protein